MGMSRTAIPRITTTSIVYTEKAGTTWW